MRVRWKALLPVIGILGAWIASPEALQLVPDKWSHVLLALSSLIAVLTPALVTNKPATARPARRSVKQTPPVDPTPLDTDSIPPTNGFPSSGEQGP